MIKVHLFCRTLEAVVSDIMLREGSCGVLVSILLSLCFAFGCDTTGNFAADNVVPYRAFLVYPIEKMRPEENIEDDGEVQTPVLIAGFEREPFIIGVYNYGGVPISIGSITISNSSGSSNLCISLFKVDYVLIEEPTWIGRAGAKGLWPDPLVPIKEEGDRYVLPVPLQVPPDENRTFLIDLFRPRYDSESTAKPQDESNKEILRIVLYDTERKQLDAVEIDVFLLPFSLPDSPALATAFGFDWTFVAERHKKLSRLPIDEKSLHLDYLHVLAANRVSIHWPAHEPVLVEEDGISGVTVDWTPFEEAAGKLLDGLLFDDVPKMTSVRFPMFVEKGELLTGDEFYTIASEYLARKGWDDRAFFYLPDEPLKREYPRVIEIAENVARLSPNIRRLVTEPFTPALEGHVEIWCPDIISIGDTIPFLPFYYKYGKLNADWQINRRPSVYMKRRSENEEAWLYTCTSAQIGRYPNLFIDYSLAYHRVIPWIAYHYGFTGILHWATTASYHLGDRNPWINQFHYHANGDGNLLYPGIPEMTGQETHLAVPSLRLIAFREGMEDFEYLSLVSEFLGKHQSDEVVSHLVRSSVRWEKSAAAYGDVKASLAALLSSLKMN